MDHTSINQIIVDIMVIFMVIGGIDRLIGNKLHLGDQFEEGINAFGALFLGMAGFVCIAPVLSAVLSPIVTPIYMKLGADPSMFATTLLAIDMGGYSVAQEMALTAEAGQFSGILLGSMLGVVVVFHIPFSLSAVEKEDQKYLATGILCGIITVPIGCFVGGLVAGFSLSMVLHNLVPIIIVSVLLALGLALIPNSMIRGFNVFGKFMQIIGGVGIVCAIVEALAGIAIIPGMAPVGDAIAICGSIAIVLAGAYPLVAVILKFFSKPLSAFGKSLGMNETAAGGLVTSLANSIPMMGFVKDMDPVGKVANFAFMCSGAFVFGDHLGFTAGVDKTMVLPLIAGKLVAGILALALALIVAKKMVGNDAAKQ